MEPDTTQATDADNFKRELDELMKKYPNIRMTVVQNIQINEIPPNTPVK